MNAVPDATTCCNTAVAVEVSDQGLLRSAYTTGMTAGAVMPIGKLAVPTATAAGARGSSDGDDAAGVVKQANLNAAAPRPSQYGIRHPLLRAAVGFERDSIETAFKRNFGFSTGEASVVTRIAQRTLLHHGFRVFLVCLAPAALARV